MNDTPTIQIDGIPRFYVVFMTTRFQSFADVQQDAPEQLARHIQTSKQLHKEGRLLMAGAFLDQPDQPLRTMGVLTSYDEAKHYAENDPFVQAGLVEDWHPRVVQHLPLSSATLTNAASIVDWNPSPRQSR